MAPPLLEGATLGERQKYYNKIWKEALVKTQSSDLEEINIQDVDINNLLKIDTANSNRNVEYILEVLRSEDTLYVSRAIKRCTWLITDPQYAHIVNPDYLHTQLFPQMTTKATNKLMLHIRLNLKDEARVEEFYNHFKYKDANTALKWLPQCSLAFIEKEIETMEIEIKDLSIIKRLCERSFSILESLIRKSENYYNRNNYMRTAMFLIHTDAEKYFDILDTFKSYYDLPDFGQKFTRLVMKICPQRILDNFPKYCYKINLEIFAKYLKKSGRDINAFMMNQFQNKSMKSFFGYGNLKHFMPKDFEFLKKVFIEKSHKVDISANKSSNNLSEIYSSAQIFSAILTRSNSANVYHWYRFAPFDVAFHELKKLIRVESAPAERNAILEVLVSCAGRNLQHMHTLLQYYHDNHINEPFKFKIQFVNNLLLNTDTHKFDNETWSILNKIFCSMEVYTDSVINVQICIQSIVVYKVLHGEKVPEVVENKLSIDTLKSQRKKLNKEEKDVIFTYLYNNLVTKMQNINIQSKAEYMEVLQLLETILNLLINWEKQLLDYPLVINEIRKLVETKGRRDWVVDLSSLYNADKSWRKHLFEYSLILFPSEEVCINALKHDPKLLERYRSDVEALCRNDRMSLDRLLSKLRIYWPESLAREWMDWYLRRLNSPGGHKALVRGLCALLPQTQLVDIARKYAPTGTKITWTEDNNIQLNLCRQFAKKLYLARPPPSPDVVLLFAHGDYLQYALPSLNAVLCNLSPANSSDQIAKFLDAPVSLQKHGIRLAFTKLKFKELKQIISDIWKSNKNSSIRAVVFTQTFNLLCREKNVTKIEEIWEVLITLIDNLSPDENKTIFYTLGHYSLVPLVVRAEFIMKAYTYLKSLPAKANCEKIVESVLQYTRDIMELLDDDFMEYILLDTLNKKCANKTYGYTNILSSYLLCTKDTKTQIQKYEKLLVPLLERCIDQWQLKIDGVYSAKTTIRDIVKHLCWDIKLCVIEINMVIPVEMFEDILTKLEGGLSIQNSYIFLRTLKLIVAYLKLLETQKAKLLSVKGSSSCQTDNRETDGINWNDVHFKIAPEFAEICIKYLKDDVKSYFPSICVFFSDALKNMFHNTQISQIVQFEILRYMLGFKESVESYAVVLRNIPHYYNDAEERSRGTEMRKTILSHPSPEIKMHYYKKFTDCDLNNEN